MEKHPINLVITLDPNAEAILKNVIASLDKAEAMLTAVSGNATPKASAKKTTTVKTQVQPVEEEVTEEAVETSDEEVDMGFEEEKPAPKKAAAPKALKLPDVIEAFKALVEAKDRPAGIALLKKYQVKSVNDLKPEQYAKVIADAKKEMAA